MSAALHVAAAHARGILDSRGRVTVEAEIRLGSGAIGRGSAPVAIAPGRRERARSEGLRLGPFAGSADAERLCRSLRGARLAGEGELDAALAASGAPADVTLALSIACWRAAAAHAGEVLHRRVAAAAGTRPGMPHPLVNVLSGGIHAGERPDSFQQLMAVPCRPTFAEDVEAALAVWADAERRLAERDRPWTLSASSGMLVEGATSAELLAELHAVTSRHERVGTGADVAAEHLAAGPGLYRLDGRTLAGRELLELLDRLAAERKLVFLEDPFAPEDEDLWRELTERLAGRTAVVGDDLFATDAARMDRSLATAVLLKPSQAGTVSATLDAARAALDAGIELCVSHRSGETEDTFVCDLAVGLGALAQKVGGPRRGDRIAKYNQLLRLAEEGGLAPSAAAIAPGARPLTAVEDT